MQFESSIWGLCCVFLAYCFCSSAHFLCVIQPFSLLLDFNMYLVINYVCIIIFNYLVMFVTAV